MKKLYFTKFHDGTIGDRTLSAWPVAPGICWVQTRSPVYAKKLSERADARLVEWGVAGGFLRTFEFKHGLAWAQKLITRYTRNDEPTNAAFLSPAASPRPQSRQIGTMGQLKLKAPGTLKATAQPLATLTAKNAATVS